jgi:hypothetical protein
MTHSTKHLVFVAAVAATALLSAGSVLAQEATPDQAKALVFTSTANRADVQAQAALQNAAFSGRGDADLTLLASVAQRPQVVATRAAVKAETVRAFRAHEVVNAGERYSVAPAGVERSASLR